jgi:hypothetical protein
MTLPINTDDEYTVLYAALQLYIDEREDDMDILDEDADSIVKDIQLAATLLGRLEGGYDVDRRAAD